MSRNEDREPDTYVWRAAPAHLMTRRQLRAAGLAPGGHAPVAQAETLRRGRRLVTYFYDANRAVPKRTATPKQLLAVAKAIREHQARAAERHGYDRAELERAQDPVPGWDHNPEFTTHKEERTMSDSTSAADSGTPEAIAARLRGLATVDEGARHLAELNLNRDSLQAVAAELGITRLPSGLSRTKLTDRVLQQAIGARRKFEGLRDWSPGSHQREEAPSIYSAVDAPPAGTPTGHGQRIAHLLAVVACNQARQRLDKLDTAVELAEQEGRESIDQLEASLQAAIDQAEARLTAHRAQHGPASVEPLADALVFRTGSDIAESRLAELISDYAAEWGVRIDAENLTVDIDPDVDAVSRQRLTEAMGVYDRKAAALDIVTALPLAADAQAAVGQAIWAWHTGIDVDSQRWLDAEPAARQQLDTDLAAARISDADRARVGFVADFLRGDTASVDLLASPVFVDPGEETRSRVPQLLESFAQNPDTAPLVGREIAVMTPEDQERVRAAGKALAEGKRVDTALWPGYVNRQALAENLYGYAAEVRDLRSSADYLAEGGYSGEEREQLGYKSSGVQDELSANIDRIVAARESLLDQVHNGQGLAAIERAHLAAVITDIDSGRTGPGGLPELLFADERTKADVDFLRQDRAAARLAADAKKEITQQIDAAADVEPKTRAAEQLTAAVDSIAETLGSVAGGSRASSRTQDRVGYRENRGRLGQALAQAGVPKPARGEIAVVLDEHARKAGEVGAAAIERADQWEVKAEHVAAVRDDTVRQRQAAAAGRARPPDAAISQTPEQRRACTARIDTSRHGAQSPAGIRQLHSMDTEVER